MLGEILGPDLLVIVVIVVVLFGGSQIPKLARSVGSARREFEAGLRDDAEKPDAEKPEVEARVHSRSEVEAMLEGGAERSRPDSEK